MNTFTPDEELINLADHFSKNYKTLSEGIYRSGNDKYEIRYVDFCRDPHTNEIQSTSAKVALHTKQIIISRIKFQDQQYTPDYVFFIIIWCHISHMLGGNTTTSDELSVRYYLTTKRNIKHLVQGYIALFQSAPNEANVKRMKLISSIIEGRA
jgi:hypothetical protein